MTASRHRNHHRTRRRRLPARAGPQPPGCRHPLPRPPPGPGPASPGTMLLLPRLEAAFPLPAGPPPRRRCVQTAQTPMPPRIPNGIPAETGLAY